MTTLGIPVELRGVVYVAKPDEIKEPIGPRTAAAAVRMCRHLNSLPALPRHAHAHAMNIYLIMSRGFFAASAALHQAGNEPASRAAKNVSVALSFAQDPNSWNESCKELVRVF